MHSLFILLIVTFADSSLELYVFTLDNCVPCAKFKQDYDKNKDGLRAYINKYFLESKEGKHFFEVKWSEGKWSNNEIVEEYKKQTGKDLESVPIFWVRGRSRSLQSYSEPKDVLDYLSGEKK